MVLRPIRPDDAGDLQNSFMRSSAQSIYLRFLSFKRALSDEEARQLATVDYSARMAFVATMLENGEEIVVGVSRYALIGTSHSKTAEAAVIVGDEFQGKGIGTLLLRRLVIYARAKGIRHLRGNLDPGNDRMLRLVQRSGLRHRQRYVNGILQVTIDIALPKEVHA